MDPVELERVTDRALRALPAPRAPRTLLPRVLAAVAAEASRPWYARAWLSWPLHWKLVSAATAAVIVVIATAGGPAVAAGMLEFATRTSLPVSSQFAGAVRGLGAMWEASRIVWDVVAPAARVLALWLLVMSAACVAFGTALDRVIALGGAVES
jgi:hypothetical protein